MDLQWLDDAQLQLFFHCKKTELSCLEKPCTFLHQLRDHNLITEDRYEKLIRMKSKENIKNGIYNFLDWLEKERSKHIRMFWNCIFNESILNQYPDLKLLRNSLMDKSFQFYEKLPSEVEEEDTSSRKRKKTSTAEEQQTPRKTKTLRTGSVCSEEETQHHASPRITRSYKKRAEKLVFSSPMKRGEKQDIWNWRIYKTQLPVKCGEQNGLLNRQKLAKGDKSILAENKWMTPPEFEEFAGKKKCRNWKQSIRCAHVTLGQLIKEGHLKCPGYSQAKRKARKSLFPSSQTEASVTGPDFEDEDEDEDVEDEDEENDQESEEQASTTEQEHSRQTTHSDEEEEEEEEEEEAEEEEETEQIPGSSHVSCDKAEFNVTCGAKVGTLHKIRFASGIRGKCIRTEKCWMSPEEFVNEGSSESDALWKKDIQWEGKPLHVLLEMKLLQCHSLLCKCRLCTQDPQAQDDQRNDDECFICKRDGEELVECDRCPRSFHQSCHLPDIDDFVKQDNRPWFCTFCVLKANQKWRSPITMTEDKALSRPISQHFLECDYLLLSLYNADEDQLFATNLTLNVRGFAEPIETPTRLEEVAKRLHEKSYQTVGQFASDVRLILTNCITFNREGGEISAMGVKLKELFEREFKNVFCIRQQTV